MKTQPFIEDVIMQSNKSYQELLHLWPISAREYAIHLGKTAYLILVLTEVWEL
jgi:hypothetical protein